MVNRGEEKVWVQMNVVPRSTGNTNNGTRELTLKCKLKCYLEPMNNPLGGSVGRVTVDLIRRSWVRFPPRSKDFFFASCGSLFPFTRANAQWVIHGSFICTHTFEKTPPHQPHLQASSSPIPRIRKWP